MALEWFAFNPEAYTGDTSHLTCEEHGAYLLLMLAYYRSERPLPGTDRALASICKLSMERWLECRPTLAPFFVEVDSTWRHIRIEAEIAEGHQRMERYSNRAKAGGEARQRKRLERSSSTTQEVQKKDTLTLTKDSLSAVLGVDKAENGDIDPFDGQLPQSNPLGRAYRELVDNGVIEPDPEPERQLTPIPPKFQPTAELKADCMAWMDASTFHIEWQKFVFDAREKGKLSADWDASLRKWMERFREYAARPNARGKPRVQLNPDPPAGDEHGPTINWPWHLSRWLKSESTWSRRTAGPEPGQIGCRVPPEMFEKFNLDPATGRRKQKEPT
jgi:uncharacterized protein YdaU (DUF1376 family)